MDFFLLSSLLKSHFLHNVALGSFSSRLYSENNPFFFILNFKYETGNVFI